MYIDTEMVIDKHVCELLFTVHESISNLRKRNYFRVLFAINRADSQVLVQVLVHSIFTTTVVVMCSRLQIYLIYI